MELPKEKQDKITVIIDSSGLKIFGEGEWKVRQHGWCKHRTWRKIHLMITPDGEIREAELTENSISDGEIAPQLIEREKADIEKRESCKDKNARGYLRYQSACTPE